MKKPLLRMYPLLAPLALFAAFALADCTTGQPQSTTAALEVSLTALESAAFQYGSLPACGTAAATAICSSPSVVQTIVNLDKQAYDAVKAASAQAAAGGTPDIAAATAALAAFQSVLNTVPKGN